MKEDQGALIVVDLGYGDAGKGTVVDFLVRTHGTSLVVRYNGGPQAGHNVVTPDGRHHTFAQFGSGTFVPGVRTHISRFMLVQPFSMLIEEEHLYSVGVRDAFERTTIDERAMIITPFQQSANRLRELARGDGRHGSCGMGVGETMADFLAYGEDVLFVGDLRNEKEVIRKLELLREAKRAELQEVFAQLPSTDAIQQELDVFERSDAVAHCLGWYRDFLHRARIVDGEYLGATLRYGESVVFEGAQGVLLDEWYGFHPYTTWSTTTTKNAEILLDEIAYNGSRSKIGVLRAYATRHGPGPFVTEESSLSTTLNDPYNTMNPWQHNFRIGWFDAVATQYALDATGGVDYLALTNLDNFTKLPYWQICEAYQYEGKDTRELTNLFELRGDEISRIRFFPEWDLDRQARLTEMLFKCSPHLRSGDTDYLDLLEDTLSTKIGIISSGPSASEKQMRGKFTRRVKTKVSSER